jgi:hypothetical protein
MDAVNTHQVFDWLWTSGQLSQGDVLKLPDLGIEVVINLALPSSPNALPAEADLVTGLGLAYIQIPVEWEHPLPEQFDQFVGVLKAWCWVRVKRMPPFQCGMSGSPMKFGRNLSLWLYPRVLESGYKITFSLLP